MFRELINKLLAKKNKLKEISSQVEQIEEDENEKEEEEEVFDISLAQEGNFLKMEISDYVSVTSYIKRMQVIDYLGVERIIGSAVLWNVKKQKVSKGTYYAVIIGNRLYNFFMDGSIIKVDERIRRDDEVVEERIVNLDIEDDDYSFVLHHHESTGNTFFTRFFNKKGPDFGKLDLSDEEFLKEIKQVIANLESIEGIDKVFDVNLLKKYILGDFEDHVHEKIMCYEGK